MIREMKCGKQRDLQLEGEVNTEKRRDEGIVIVRVLENDARSHTMNHLPKNTYNTCNSVHKYRI